ncbi:uncharacterized protein SEPMUDRAFT_106135 [Sphaerulina musiva SO2202]|uniref:BRCT domain-containing protein n=1 Tax=Sphaerulina musiva (strain SO2202) TaxID=692275 RepID=M3B7Z7_SPHMS|nr:uncharacterized protein SEPMUDRAFT_106135 [Sphaerulina musiva SO2202]EMF15952.1 hypothetical protein SEPMUDRAFT_106135 [Sphaerulina musiva SO2202]
MGVSKKETINPRRGGSRGAQKSAARTSGAASDGPSASKKAKRSMKSGKNPWEGIPNCLAGKSFHFCGTGMKLTLSLLALTAVNHGGALELKLENADFVIIGKIGNNQQKTITENALVTLTEAEFKEWIETGDAPT